jgi:hypothetical protein
MICEVTCEVKSGACRGFAFTYVYRWGGRFFSCLDCLEAVKTTDVVCAPKEKEAR